MSLIEIRDLSFRYEDAEDASLSRIDLRVDAGEYLCLIGKSGCGKTTLLKQLKPSIAPNGQLSGEILLDGTPIEDVPEREQASRVCLVMQDPDAQIVTDKVWHELAFGLESLGVDQDVMRIRVAEMASFFGIQQWLDEDVDKLSGGQKQLLNLASAMAVHPEVLLLDEPTSQLDPVAALDLLNAVRKVNLELGTTVIIAEHRLEDVYASADAVVVLDDGEIAFAGPPEDVAAALYSSDDDMTLALPSPVRIYFGVESSETRCGMSESGIDVPLTVRDGRMWLSRHVAEHPPGLHGIPLDPSSCHGKRRLALRLKGVWFRYGKGLPDVLRDLDLEVPEGALFAVVGGNGVGKTTLLRTVCATAVPHRGKVELFGRNLKSWKKKDLFHGVVSMLCQDPRNLFVSKTVRGELEEMVDDPMSAGGEKSILEVVEVCELEGLLDCHPFDVSGGEQQRVALAKVLLTEPRILLLDEPTKGLDAFFKKKLASILRRLVDEKGTTVVMVSHDVEFCARYADEVGMLFDGDAIACAAPRRFFSSNAFYTTAANRMSRSVFANAILDEDVIGLCMS